MLSAAHVWPDYSSSSLHPCFPWLWNQNISQSFFDLLTDSYLEAFFSILGPDSNRIPWAYSREQWACPHGRILSSCTLHSIDADEKHEKTDSSCLSRICVRHSQTMRFAKADPRKEHTVIARVTQLASLLLLLSLWDLDITFSLQILPEDYFHT